MNAIRQEEIEAAATPRRAMLKKLGRFAAVTPPTVTLILAATTKPAAALSPPPESSRQFKIGEGSVEGSAVLNAIAALPFGARTAMNNIDGVGVCFAAIKALAARIDALQVKLGVAA